MNTEHFNYLLTTYYENETSALELCKYCLANIKRRLLSMYKNIYNVDDVAREILSYFLKNLPKHVFAPFKFINATTDNYIKRNYKKIEEVVPLSAEMSYEQSFDELQKLNVLKFLEKHLDKCAAQIVYLHIIEDIKEKDIAVKLNISYVNVRAIYSRAIKKLKEILSDVTILEI